MQVDLLFHANSVVFSDCPKVLNVFRGGIIDVMDKNIASNQYLDCVWVLRPKDDTMGAFFWFSTSQRKCFLYIVACFSFKFFYITTCSGFHDLNVSVSSIKEVEVHLGNNSVSEKAEPLEVDDTTVYSSDIGPLYIHIVFNSDLVYPTLFFTYGSMKKLSFNSSLTGI